MKKITTILTLITCFNLSAQVTLQQTIDFLNEKGQDKVTIETLVQINNAGLVIDLSSIESFECPEEENEETEFDAKATVSFRFAPGSRNMSPPMQFDNQFKKGDKILHLKSGTEIYISWIGMYGGNLVHVGPRDAPYSSELIVQVGDKFKKLDISTSDFKTPRQILRDLTAEWKEAVVYYGREFDYVKDLRIDIEKLRQTVRGWPR